MRPSRRTIDIDKNSYTADRRSSKRYAIHLPFSGAVGDQEWVALEGTTVNISSHGILLSTPEDAPVVPLGACARILIDWPTPPRGRMELAIVAKVVRTGRNQVAAQLWSHHFQLSPVTMTVERVKACRN